jgi:peptidoglycan/xylan/chitin deacetylase (PgdA/CDA1 family)
MKSKKSTIIILLLFTALVLAGVFYWQTYLRQKTSTFKYSNENTTLPQTSEKEIATSTPPFVVKGEISAGNPARRQIIFTFDAGAGTNSLPKILETAKQHKVQVTFFSTGKFAQKNPDAIKQIAQSGYEIFNHTYSHPYLTQISDEQIKQELDQAEQILSGLTGKTTKPFFRPPYGDRNAHVLEVAKAQGYQSVFWTLDALDWEASSTADFVKNRIETHLKNGSIILMHVGDDITGQILNEVFSYIENQGYKIVSLSEGLK